MRRYVVLGALGLLGIILAACGAASAQSSSQEAAAASGFVSTPNQLNRGAQASTQGELTMMDLLRMEGEILAQGDNTVPTAANGLKTYRVEELTLDTQIVNVDGETIQVAKAWRVTVTGGPFPVRAIPPLIWIDGTILGVGLESVDLSEISVVIFDDSLLRDGATIGFSYGENGEHREDLPEKLDLAGEN